MTEPGRQMRVWGLTGLIAAGKSRVCGILEELGAQIIQADRLGHALLETPEMIGALSAAFGDSIRVDGRIDRARLGRRVFADPEALDRLNGIVHPRLSRSISETLEALRVRRPQPALAVIEAAVYFQLPPFGQVDLVVAVTADPDLRRRRLLQDSRLTPADADRRISAQTGLEAAIRGADVILENNGDIEDLRAKVTSLFASHVPTRSDGGAR